MRFLFALFYILLASCVPQINSGQEILYKADYSKKIMEYQSFPMSAWSYIVTDSNYRLSNEDLDVIEKSFPVILDAEDPRGMNQLLEDWILDGVFLDKAPDNIGESFAAAISKAQFFEMFSPGGLEYVQNDPFGRSEKFMSIWSENFHLSDENKELNFKFTPILSTRVSGESIATDWTGLESFFKIRGDHIRIIGAEFFARVNKLIILSDLKRVGLLGGFFLVILLLGLLYFSLYKVLLFLPVIGVAMYLAILGFCALEGGIHGLILSFGTSVIGLSMDYAIHAVHAKDKTKLWRKNLIAFLTTAFAFVCLSFSSLPLFRGIALFSVLGLSLSFVLMWAFDRRFKVYQKSAFSGLKERALSQRWIYSIFILLPFLGLTVQYNKSLKPFLYTPPSVQGVMDDLSKNQGEVLVRISDVSEKKKIRKSFGLISFSGDLDKSQVLENTKAWNSSLKSFDKSQYNGFFKPYVKKMLKKIEKGIDLNESFYASLFLSGDREIEFLKVEDEVDFIEAKKEGFWSPRNIVDEMGGAGLAELIKLFVLAIVLAFLALLFVFKDVFKVLAIFFPFALSVCVFLILSLFAGFQVNLVHIIGLLIVFGISLDYGVFGVEASEEERSETFSAFCLSGLSTFFGFAPLILTLHPVLQSLGLVLVVGVVCSFTAGLVLLSQPSRG